MVVEIRNALGQIVYSFSAKSLAAGEILPVDISRFGKGVYMMNWKSSETQQVKKILIN